MTETVQTATPISELLTQLDFHVRESEILRGQLNRRSKSLYQEPAITSEVTAFIGALEKFDPTVHGREQFLKFLIQQYTAENTTVRSLVN